MLDSDLAELYQVQTKAFNQSVQRNLDRFPNDFMFQLTPKEVKSLTFQSGISNFRSQIVTESLRSQIVTSKEGRGGRRYLPYAFTEHGVAMLSSVLKSQRAVQMNILIIRAFITLREMLATHKDLAKKIEKLNRKQKEYGQQLASIYSIVNQLINPPLKPKQRIGFEPRIAKV
jgi:hypothetical protein